MGFRTWLLAQWDRVLGFALIGVGGLVLLLGYAGVSESTDTPEALSYVVSGGLGGLFLLGVGATLLISADLHDEWRKLDRVEAALDRAVEPADATPEEPLSARGRPGVWITKLKRPVAGADNLFAVTVPGVPASVGWTRILTVGLAAALGIITTAWWRTAYATSSQSALSGMALASAGLILTGLTATGSTLTMKRAIQQRKFRLLSFWMLDSPTASPARKPSPLEDGASILVVQGLTEFHRPGCAAIDGLATREVQRQCTPPGLRPCLLCEA